MTAGKLLIILEEFIEECTQFNKRKPDDALVENMVKRIRSRFFIAVLLTTLICSH